MSTSVFLDRIDAAPLEDDDFSETFNSWIANTVDSLNETIVDTQDQLNGLGVATFIASATQAQIIALAPNVNNGAFWYCIDHAPPCFVGKQNGVLVQFTTAAFP